MCTFSANVRQRRQALGLTQDELAARLHVTRQAVSGWERGKTQPDLDTLAALAQALDAQPADLLGGGEDGAGTGAAPAPANGARPWLTPLAQAAAALVLLGLTQALVQGPVRQFVARSYLWAVYVPFWLCGLLPAYWLLARALARLLGLAGLPSLPPAPRRVLRVLAWCFLAYTLAVAAAFLIYSLQALQAQRLHLSYTWTCPGWMIPWLTILLNIPLRAHGLFALMGLAFAFTQRPKQAD